MAYVLVSGTGGWAGNGFQAVTRQFASVFMSLWVVGAGMDVIVGIELFGGTNGDLGRDVGTEGCGRRELHYQGPKRGRLELIMDAVRFARERLGFEPDPEQARALRGGGGASYSARGSGGKRP